MSNAPIFKGKIERAAALYREAILEWDRMLSKLERMKPSPESSALTLEIKAHKVKVEALRLKFNRVYGPLSLRVIAEEKLVRRFGPSRSAWASVPLRMRGRYPLPGSPDSATEEQPQSSVRLFKQSLLISK